MKNDINLRINLSTITFKEFENVIIYFLIFLLAFLQRANDPLSFLNNFNFFFKVILGITFLVLFLKEFPKIFDINHNIWLFSFIILLLISSFWSISFKQTFEKSIWLIISTSFSYYLFLRFGFTKFLQIIFISLLFILAASLILIAIFPEKGIHLNELHYGAWRGIYFHKSGLGREMVLAGLIGLYIIRKPYNLIFFLICSIIVYMTQSIISVFCMTLIITYYFGSIYIKKIKESRRYYFEVIIIILLLLLSVVVINYVVVLNLVNKDITFSGRVPIWLYAIYNIKLQPLLGYGYGVFWEYDIFELYSTWDIPHAHNHFLDVLLDVGIIGLVVFFIVLLSFFIKSYKVKSINPDLFDVIFLSVVALLLISSSENSIHQPYNLLWIYFCCIVLYSTNSSKKIFDNSHLLSDGLFRY